MRLCLCIWASVHVRAATCLCTQREMQSSLLYNNQLDTCRSERHHPLFNISLIKPSSEIWSLTSRSHFVNFERAALKTWTHRCFPLLPCPGGQKVPRRTFIFLNWPSAPFWNQFVRFCPGFIGCSFICAKNHTESKEWDKANDRKVPHTWVTASHSYNDV